MSRLLATHAAAMCAIAGAALGDSAGFVGGGLSNSERKRIRDRNGPYHVKSGSHLADYEIVQSIHCDHEKRLREPKSEPSA